jgi:hypothetical protein
MLLYTYRSRVNGFQYPLANWSNELSYMEANTSDSNVVLVGANLKTNFQYFRVYFESFRQ